MIDGFTLTFEFESEYLDIDDALGVIKMKIFDDGPFPLDNQPKWVVQLESALECYKLEEEKEDDEPNHTNIPESEGSREVQGSKLQLPKITSKLKTKKVNIETEAEPKLAAIGDYWHEENVGHIRDLLKHYEDLFPTKFTKMKGILGDMEVMRIPLKEGVKPIR